MRGSISIYIYTYRHIRTNIYMRICITEYALFIKKTKADFFEKKKKNT